MSNWLIAANRDVNILQCVKYLLEQYWAKNNYPINYFLFHMFFSLAAKRFPDEWAGIPTFTNDTPHILSGEISEQFTEKRFIQICKLSNIHKLSLKRNYENMPKDSFYDILIRKSQNEKSI